MEADTLPDVPPEHFCYDSERNRSQRREEEDVPQMMTLPVRSRWASSGPGTRGRSTWRTPRRGGRGRRS